MNRLFSLLALSLLLVLAVSQVAFADEHGDAPKFNIGAIYVIAEDFDGLSAWYQDTFGFTEVHFDPTVPIRVFAHEGGHPFAVISSTGIEHPLASPRHNSVVFDFTVPNCAAAFEWAVSHGASAYVEPTPMPGITLAVIGDPEGNEIWLIEWSVETTAAHEAAMATKSGELSECKCGSMCACGHCKGTAEVCTCGK